MISHYLILRSTTLYMEQLFLPHSNLHDSLRSDSKQEVHTSLQLTPADLSLIVAFPTHLLQDAPPPVPDIDDQPRVKTEPVSPLDCSCAHVKTEPTEVDLDNNQQIKVEPESAADMKTEPLDSEPDIETEPVFPEPLADSQQMKEAGTPSLTNTLTINKVRQNQLSQLLEDPPLSYTTFPSLPRVPCHMTSPWNQILTQNLALPAYYLFQKQEWQELYHYLSNTDFPSEYHPRLQELWFSAHYENYRTARGITSLNPSQKYRIRFRNPLPQSLSSVKFKSNNNFSSRVKALLDKYFEISPYVSGSELDDLSEKTELSTQQIKNYFKNKRTRSK